NVCSSDLAAKQIEWSSEHPAYLRSLHPCEDIWDEYDIESSGPANDNSQRLVALAKTFPEQPTGAATNKDITFPRTRDAVGGVRSEGEAGPSAGQSPRTGTGWGLTQVEVGLQYFGKRYLNPLLGRWVSADPLAVHAPGEADLNLYAYVSGAVLKNVDPLGLEAEAADTAATLNPDAPIVGAGTVDFPADTIHAGSADGLEGASDSVLEGGPQGPN